jgi:hypothetical protein
MKQFGNRPHVIHVIRKPCFHGGCDSQTGMYSAKLCVAGLISGHPIALARVPLPPSFSRKARLKTSVLG